MPAPLMCVLLCPCCPVLSVCVRPRPHPFPPRTDGFTSEGEILEISDIQRGQAGEYECVTHNGVNSAPDSRRVLVTVNCEPLGTGHERGAGPGSLGRGKGRAGLPGRREEGEGDGTPESPPGQENSLTLTPRQILRPSRT